MINIILDNIIFSLQKAGGISVVWQHLVENLLKTQDDLRLIEYGNASQNIFRQQLRIPQTNLMPAERFNKLFSQLKHSTVTSDKPFIFHSSYFRTCRHPHAVNITTVHDFIYEQGAPTWRQRFRIRLNYNAIRNSAAVVCISRNTKNDLFRFLPDIPPEKVHVIYNGVSEDYHPLGASPYPRYRDHVLFVGGRHGYKNFDFVVRALTATRYKLLICGAPLNREETAMLDKLLKDRYTHIKFPTNDQLNDIYNSVHCLAYPSSYEGFGIPVLEAQRAGCPVLALSASSIPEIIGDHALLMPRLSEKSFLSLLHVADDPEQRAQVIASGIANAKRFSWEKMAQAYLDLYKQLLNK